MIEMFKLSASQSNSKACYELSKIYASGLHGVTQGSTRNKKKWRKIKKWNEPKKLLILLLFL